MTHELHGTHGTRDHISGKGAFRFIRFALIAVSAFLLLHVVFLLQWYMVACRWVNSAIDQYGSDQWMRLAFVADPQMEGDGRVLREGMYGQLNNDINDYSMRHIARSIRSVLQPRQLFVLGDLFSSEYLGDTEFRRRAKRFRWIFEHSRVGHRQERTLTDSPYISGSIGRSSAVDGRVLARAYQVNLAGNHDIGYGIDVNLRGYSRFVKEFGPLNVDYEIDIAPSHDSAAAQAGTGRLWVAIVDSTCLDGTADKQFHTTAWRHLEYLASKRRTSPHQLLLLLTHIPLWKPEGSCVDRPMTIMRGNAVAKQNFLSANTTSFILEHIRPTVIFSGHDHEGCEYVHGNSHGDRIPEHTVRSMMGRYGGVSAVLEVDASKAPPTIHHYTCPFATTGYLVTAFTVTLLWFASMGVGFLLRGRFRPSDTPIGKLE